MVNKGHIYTNAISGNRGQVSALKVPEGSVTISMGTIAIILNASLLKMNEMK
jgi:hypothetical protein